MKKTETTTLRFGDAKPTKAELEKAMLRLASKKKTPRMTLHKFIKQEAVACSGKKNLKDWICQCGDTTVVPRGDRCPKCGKCERDKS